MKNRPRMPNWLVRTFRNKIRPMFSRRLSKLAAMLVPSIYLAYMRLVWATSRIESHNFLTLKEIIAKYNGAVGLLWHEEVLTVAFGYAHLGFRPHTLASIGPSGEVIARILARCGFVVFRGGSTTHRSRRREGALQEMIAHMQTHDQVIYGLTVDGSKGPPYRMKTGGLIVARECGKPIALARTWYKRCLRLPTWDRMALPLPFNVIGYYLKGPYFVPDSAQTEAGLEQFRQYLEDELIDLAAHSYEDLGQARPANLVKRSAQDA
ncbi:MAG: lysophospholipid acyltransferase family protein [Candidatus Binatia bacterium]